MKRIISLALCFMLAFTLCQPAFAAGGTITWTGDSSNNWNVAGNWNPEQVPGAGDTAVIPASTVAAAVYDTTSVTLDCSGEVSVESGKTLWLTGTSYLKSGKLSGDGNITIMVDDSELQWSGGSIEGNGTFTVGENTRLVIDTVSDVGMSRPLENNGQVMLTNGELLLMGGGTGTGTFTVSGGAYLRFEQGNYSIGGDFVNSGEMTIWNKSSVCFDADYWQEDESTLVLKVWGDGSDQYCKLDVAGAATLGGILEIDFIKEYAPLPGDSFEIVTCGSRANEFSEIRNNMEDVGITLVPTYTETGLTLTVSGGAAKVWEVKDAEELENALNGFKSGDTIKLLDNITYTSPVEVDGETIYFELGNYNLLVDTSDNPDESINYILTVKNGGKVKLDGAGTGKFNITSSSSDIWEGVRVLGADSEVTVNNVDVTGEEATGVYAKDGNVVINGDIAAGHRGVTAVIAGTSVTVNGNITVLGNGLAGEGIYADEKTTISVTGDVTVQGTDYIGVHAAGGTIEVDGDVVSSGIGAKAKSRYTEGKGEVKIHGSLSAGSPFIIVGTTEKTAADITEPTTETGFLTYSDGVNTVWIGSVGDPVVTAPTAPQSFAAAPGDGQVALSWAAPASNGGSAIIKYQVSKDNGVNWTDAGLNTTHTFTGLTNDTEYFFKVRAVNSAGNGAEVSVSATPAAGTDGEFAPGSGNGTTPETAFLIATPEHLNNVRNYLGAENADKHFKLTANLNLNVAPYNSGTGWEPIGTSAVPFTGAFDGDGHTISGLFIDRRDIDDNNMGLFGYAGATAKIRDLGLTGVKVTGSNYVGGLAGQNRGQVTNSYVTGDVNGRSEVGGLVGENDGSIADSYATGTVTDTWSGSIGGLAGENLESGTITNCHAEVTVTSNSSFVGGLVGNNYGTITKSHAVGEVKGLHRVGGLVGINNEGNIDKSYATGTVTGTETGISYTLVGGLVGSNTGPISDSFARGAVSGQEDIGGLVGYNSSSITNSYATGAVSGDSYIGGLVGFNHSDGIITGSYWDTETSCQTSSEGGEGKNTIEMKQQETYDGWDFAATWGINAGDNDGYPFLAVPTAPTVPTMPQSLTAMPGDGQAALSWTAPASDGGRAIIRYEVSSDNGSTWVTAATNTSHTFTGLTNGTAYTFKVRAVNSVGSGAEASATATPTAASTAYAVTVNGSYAAITGAGSYAQGATVTISAGSRSSYTFAGWTSPDGVTFMNANNATTTFTMPPSSVTVTANWTYRGGGGSGGGSSTPTTPAAPAAPAYKADVKEGSGAETTIPVTVDKDTGTASVDAGSQGLDQGGTIITIPPVPDVNTYSVGIPVPDLSTSDIQGTLTVNTNAGNITVPSNMLTGVSGISGSKAEIAIGQGDKDNLPDTVKAAIGDRPLLQLSLSIDGKQTDWSNPDAPVTVSISYTPTAAELANPESIVVWYIDGSGNVVSVPNGRYDPTTGMVTFTTAHFSDYAVAYNKVSFNDVAADAWYHKAVSFIAARGITGGTGNGNYSPEARLTRGQFVVMLMKAYGISPDADLKNNFADAGSAYYTGYLAAAKRLSISSGVGNNMFEPEKEITRQEMFTLLYNALKIIGRLPQNDSGKTLSDFTDSGQIDSWAREAMALLVETGTIGGNAGKLNPTSTTTRAEMAQVLYNLLSK